jgi:hypothetical protein
MGQWHLTIRVVALLRVAIVARFGITGGRVAL